MKFPAILIIILLCQQLSAQDTLKITEETAYIKELEFNTTAGVLYAEISGIKTMRELVEYLHEHAATEADFDTIYHKLSGKKVDQGFTSNILKGQFQKGDLNSLFLYLIGRNFRNKLTGGEKSKEPVSMKEVFKSFLEKEQNKAEKAIYADLSKGNFHRFGTNYFMNHESVFDGNLATIKKQLLTDADHLEEFYVNGQVEKAKTEELVFEFFFIESAINCSGYMPTTELGKSVKGYISAQVFKDLIFVWVNDKFVWLDVES